MPGRPRKAAGALTGHRKNDDTPADLRVLVTQDPAAPPASPAVPPLPPGTWLKVTKERWERFWTSPIAWHTDRDCDDPVVLRWIRAFDRWERANRALSRQGMIVEGSTGQDRLNPLAAYIDRLETAMRREERQLGIGAQNRGILARMGGGFVPSRPSADDPDDDLDDFAVDDPAAAMTWVER